MTRIQEEMDDGVATRAHVRAITGGERGSGSDSELEPHRRRDGDIESERGLERAAVRHYAIDARLGDDDLGT